MAGKIKGITIEIGGDTQKLNKALEDVNKKTRDVQSELRQVERLLKLDPGNTDLLAQRQKLLADAVENSREKLDRLKTAQEQVNEQFRKGEIDEEQYRAFQREVVKAEQELSKFEKQLRETGLTAEQVGKKMQDAGQKMTDVGKNLTMKVTAPILGIGAAATKVGMDFEAAMSEVGAISGATGDDLAALEEKAKEMGATTKFSASQSAEALKYMAMAGWDTQKMLDGLPGVMNLAAASGEALGTVSDIVTDAMTAFGMEAARAGEFADTLAAASSSSNTNVGLLGESFKYVAPLAGALGYEAKDTAIALGLMANAGIKGSQSGTAMRSMLTRLAKPTKESGTAMETLGISITNSEGKMKSLAEIMGDLRTAFQSLDPDQQAFYAAQIAGQEAMSGLLAVVNASEDDYNKLSDAINGSTGAAQRMADEMQDNLQGRLTILMSSIEGVALQLYDNMKPALDTLVASIQSMVEWLGSLSPEMQHTIVVIAGLAAAIGPLLVIIGTLVSSIGAIVGALGGIAIGPILAVVAAIAALVAGVVALWKNNEQFREGIIGIWEKVKEIALPIIEMFKETIARAVEAIKPAWESLKAAFQDLLPVLEVVGAAIGAILAVVVGVVVGVVNGIINALAPLIEAFGGLFSFIVNVVNAIISLFRGDFAGAWEYVKKAGEGIVKFFKGLVEAIFGFVKGLVEGVVNFFKNLYDTLIGHSIIPDLINGIIKWFSELPGKVFNAIKDMIGKIVSGIKDRVATVREAAASVINTIKNVFEGLPGKALEWGKNIITKVADGIKGAVGKVTGAVSKVVGAIRDFFPFSPAKAGPLKVLPDFGEYIKAALEKSEGSISRALDDVLRDFSPRAELALAGGIGAAASSTGRQAIDLNVNVDLRHVPAGVDQRSLEAALAEAVTRPRVRQKINEALHLSGADYERALGGAY